MAKIARKTASIFGGSAAAASLGIGVFGTLQNPPPEYSLDPAVIQASASWPLGWASAIKSYYPALEDLNAVDFVNSYQAAYILQMGIPEWDAATTYFTNSIVQYNGFVYQSATDNNLGNTPGVSTTWKGFDAIFSTSENLFRNAGMQVAQRGTSGTITAGSPAYTLDGWIVGSIGNNVGWALQEPATPLALARLKLTPSGGTPTDVFVKQRVESAVISTAPTVLTAKLTVQAQIWNNTGTSFTPTVAVNYANSKDNFAATTSLLAATNLQVCPNGGPTTVAYTFSISILSTPNAYNGIEVIIDFGNNLNAGDIGIGAVSLSVTPNLQTGLQPLVAAPQIRPIGVEMPNCQRYLYKIGGDAGFQSIGFGFNTSTTTGVVLLPIPQMRALPVLTVNNPTHFGIQDAQAATITATTAVAIYYNGSNQIMLQGTVASGLTNGGACAIITNNHTDAVLFLSAEL